MRFSLTVLVTQVIIIGVFVRVGFSCATVSTAGMAKPGDAVLQYGTTENGFNARFEGIINGIVRVLFNGISFLVG